MRKNIVSSLLKEGMVISTRLSFCNVWTQNIIYKVKNRSVTVALLTDYLESIIMPGQPFLIKYSNENSEYVFKGEVTKVDPEFPSSVTINVLNVTELKNQRVFPRVDAYLAANIKLEDDNQEYFAVIHDISLVGMAFYCKDILEPEDKQIECFIYLPNKQTISAKGKIVRTIFKNDDIIDYGIQYIEMHEENNNSLSNFFTDIEEVKSKLQSEFVNSIKKHL
ncbi:PilZ domain-containing protein [Herbivorax sp. ANBcel31]|uniref:PilZ domain-containing protein n=1 Tax=Herbivorax sp. ANBcel31 TaxID=3069754 RepID=UPI0027B5AA73|nr:PilZ domain-containing protein [Herbivorax sp. ANBcel31]MDQ2085409.1 PilZ domain-containing protein [Herbivorax sp. ANBcel31]